MSINLSANAKNYIEQAVSQGTYPSEQAALDTAVQLLKVRDKLLSDLQAADRQIDAGELIPSEEVFRLLEEEASRIEDAVSHRS